MPHPRTHGFPRRSSAGIAKRIAAVGLCIALSTPALSAAALPEVQRRIAALRSPVSAVRATAARHLGELGDTTVGPHLVRLLSDPMPAVRRETARALGRLRFRTATRALIRRLEDTDVNVRFYAAWALGELCAREAVPALVTALSDADWNVRNQAAWALRVIQDPAGVKLLVRMLNNPKTDRKQVLWIVQGFPAKQAVPEFVRLLHRARSADLRVPVVRLLGKTGNEAALEAIEQAVGDGAATVRCAALEVLSRNPREVFRDRFAELAHSDPDRGVRAAAAAALKAMVVARGVGAWWTFDEKDPETVRDATGQGNDGKVVKCSYATGRVGSALVCRNGGYVEFGQPAHLEMANRPFSITAWVYPEKTTGVVVARGGAWCGFSLYMKDGVAKFGIHRLRDGPAYTAAAKSILSRNWTYLAGVVHKNRIELYVNGKLAATTKTEGYLPSNCGQGLEIGFDVGNSPVEITDHFTGLIDEVRFWTKSLSTDEIRAEMQAGAAPGKEK